MRKIISILGVLLIIYGIFVFAYKGYTYTTREKVAEIGSLQVTAENEKTVYIPPIVGGVSIVVGLVLVIVGRRR